MRPIVLTILVLSGCGRTPPPPSPSAPASASPPPAEVEVGPLEPGRYTFSGFAPSITLEVGEGWEGAHRLPEFWDVVRGELPVLTAVQFSRPSVIYGPALGLETEVAADALSAWPDNLDLTVSELQPATIDGQQGTQIDLANVSDGSVTVWGGPEGNLAIPPGTTVRVVVLETDDELLLVSRQGPTDTFADVLAVTEPVFESIRIGD